MRGLHPAPYLQQIPEGTRIEDTSRAVAAIEEHIRRHGGVTAVASFVGRGPLRFLLVFEPEMPTERTSSPHDTFPHRTASRPRMDLTILFSGYTIGVCQSPMTISTRQWS